MSGAANNANNSENVVVCYAPTMVVTNGVWQGDNPLDYSLPLFLLQLLLIVLTTRILMFILKPLRQPRVIAEILGGIILGPSVLGRNTGFALTIFPLRSVMVLETMANIGLLYFLFLVGVEMDIAVLRRTGGRAISIAIAGMILPFFTGCAFTMLIQKHVTLDDPQHTTRVLFLGIALAVTAFPVLARILAELKLLNTELGKIAMSSALVNDICAWILLAIAIALAETESASLASLWVVLSSAGFIFVCFFGVRPAIVHLIKQTPDGESLSDFYVCLILTGVMIAGFVTDAIGTHSVFGAFIFGLIIPNGPLGLSLIEKLEDFVSAFLLPLFFAISGLKTNVDSIKDPGMLGVLAVVIVLSCLGKVVGTTVMSYFYNIPISEGIALGFMMNAKGLLEMIILNVGRDQKVLDDASFALMVITAIFMTGIITPIVTTIYRPTRKSISYKQRTLQNCNPETELRILVPIHTPRNVPTIINLLEATNYPARNSQSLCIYVLHLVELTGRASAMLIVHSAATSGSHQLHRTQAQSEHIVHAFRNYEHDRADHVSVQPLTAVSPYSTMHEDICNLAEDKRVSFIIVPFHKQQTVDGGMEAPNPAIQLVNQNVLANAPCSVGILVDRGLSGSKTAAAMANAATNANNAQTTSVTNNVAVLFFGGRDDREALTYASKMAEHPNVSITVMRFLQGDEAERFSNININDDDRNQQHNVLKVEDDDGVGRQYIMDRDRQLDEDCLRRFKAKALHEELNVTIHEVVVSNGEQTVATIRSIDGAHDLFIVGRGQGEGGRGSALTDGLTDWSECPELGAIGDLLASSDFAATISVLVVQQYAGWVEPEGGGEDDGEYDEDGTMGQQHREAQYEFEMSQRKPQIPRNQYMATP